MNISEALTLERELIELEEGHLSGWGAAACRRAAQILREQRIMMNGTQLPSIEEVSSLVHAAWMDGKRAQGVSSRKAEDGEELMVPYADLSEKAKELDRCTVRAVFAAIEKCGR